MQKSINWPKTLKSIIYTHNFDTVSFTIKEIEDLQSYLKTLQITIDTQKDKIKILQMDKSKLLVKLSQYNTTEKLSDFTIYA